MQRLQEELEDTRGKLEDLRALNRVMAGLHIAYYVVNNVTVCFEGEQVLHLARNEGAGTQVRGPVPGSAASEGADFTIGSGSGDGAFCPAQCEPEAGAIWRGG